MKKVLFLTMMVMMMGCQRSCEKDVLGGFPFPPGVDWALDIVKFKNPEYKNHILTRKYEIVDSTKNITQGEKYRYAMPIPNIYEFEDRYLPASSFFEKVWIPLSGDYFLCYWKWTNLFCLASNPYTWSEYAMFNVAEFNGDIDRLVLMEDKWVDWSKTSLTWDEIFEDSIKTDSLCYKYGIMDESPIAEHYVVTAKSLYDFTGSPCDKTSKIFLEYDPLNDNTAGLAWELNETYQVQEGDRWVVRDFFPKTYDSLFDKMNDMLKTVITSGRLQEYIDYDLKYNNVEERRKEWQYRKDNGLL